MTESSEIDYYDRSGLCRKCGSAAVTTHYCERKTEMYGLGGGYGRHSGWWASGHGPHMHRSCQNCKHSFTEIPLDADPTEYTDAAIAVRADADEQELERLNESERRLMTAI